MNCVGIDLGSFSIKLAEVQSSGKSLTLTRFQEFPLSSDPNKDKKIEMLDILRQIAAGYDADNTQFVFAMPQHQVSLRHRHFPFRERFKILRTVGFELEDDVPFSQDEAIFEAKITRLKKDGASVVACAVLRSHVRDMVSLIREAGIQPKIVTAEGFALANHLENWSAPTPEDPALADSPEARPAEIILDLGHQRSVMSILSEGSLLVSRNIDIGGRHIAEAIAAKYGIHYLEALKELQKKAFVLISHEGATADQIAFSEVIKGALETLVQEVRLTLLEVVATHQVRITAAHLCGGVSQIRNLGAYFTQRWETPVNRLKHLQRLTVLDPDSSGQLEAVSTLALGLCYEGQRKARNPAINLLKNEFLPRSESFQNFINKWGYTGKIVGAAMALMLVFGIMRENYATRMNEILDENLKDQGQRIAKLSGRQNSLRNIRRFVREKKQEAAGRKSAEDVKQINSALDVVAELHRRAGTRSSTPVVIRRLSVNNDSLEVMGDAPAQLSLLGWRKTLEELAVGGKLENISGLQAPEGRQAFAYRLKVLRR